MVEQRTRGKENVPSWGKNAGYQFTPPAEEVKQAR
jgi:hypothetical protein